MQRWGIAKLPGSYQIDVTPNGYITDETFYAWLTKMFYPITKKRQLGTYRLLLFDGHTTHLTIEVVQFCNEQKILPFLTPAHLTHLVQPLDVGVFGPWKDYYSEQVDLSFRKGGTVVDKIEFLDFLDKIRVQTMRPTVIKSAWKRAGLYLYNPSLVIDPLRERTRQKTPPLPIAVQWGSFPTPTTARSYRKLCDILTQLVPETPRYATCLEKVLRGGEVIAHMNRHLKKNLDETRAAEKRRRELRLEARKTVPCSGLVTLDGLRFMTRTKEEKAQREAEEKQARQQQRETERAQKEEERERKEAERAQEREEKARIAAEEEQKKEERDNVQLRKANQRFHAAISKVGGQAEKKRKAEQMEQDKENQKQKKRVKLTKYGVDSLQLKFVMPSGPLS